MYYIFIQNLKFKKFKILIENSSNKNGLKIKIQYHLLMI